MVASSIRKIVRRVYPPRHLAFYLQRLATKPSTRRWLATLAKRRLPPAQSGPGSAYQGEVAELDSAGYVMLPGLVDATAIGEIKAWLTGRKVYDRWNPSAGSFDADAPPDACHTAPYYDEDVVNCPHVLRWANDPRVLGIVERALGARPTLSNLTIWWSYPGHATPQEAENFHRDVDDLHFIKLFVYLTDVDDGCGPHAFVPGSQNDHRLSEIRRYQDEEIIETFGDGSIKYFTGASGTSFLENTFGLHKGQLPERGRRLLFQAQYSLHPIGIYAYKPVKRNRLDGASLDPYINRLYVRP